MYNCNKDNEKNEIIENKRVLRLDVSSIDKRFEKVKKLIISFGAKELSLSCCSATWMDKSSAADIYALESYTALKLQPEMTNMKVLECMIITIFFVFFAIFELDTDLDRNYFGI